MNKIKLTDKVSSNISCKILKRLLFSFALIIYHLPLITYLFADTRVKMNSSDGKQKNNMLTLTAGIRKKLNEVSALMFTFSSVVATSNNHFECYLPSNYSGQSFSLGYQLTY